MSLINHLNVFEEQAAQQREFKHSNIFLALAKICEHVIYVCVQSEGTYRVLSFFIPSNMPMESSMAHEISLLRISL